MATIVQTSSGPELALLGTGGWGAGMGQLCMAAFLGEQMPAGATPDDLRYLGAAAMALQSSVFMEAFLNDYLGGGRTQFELGMRQKGVTIDPGGGTVGPSRTLTPNEVSVASLPDLPTGYHYRSVGGEVQVVRNPGQAGNLPPMHLEGAQLVLGPKPSVVRNSATRSAFLKDLANNDRTPSSIRPWLRRGKVPPGYTVHHRQALFDGGTDTVDNMVLQGVDLHHITHRFYRPGGQVPTINPPPATPY